MVRTGEVAQDLLRPLDYLSMQLAITLGTAAFEGIISAFVTIFLGICFIGIIPPISLVSFVLFLISIFLGFLIKFLVTFLSSLLCFWTINSIGIVWAQTAIINFFSGMLIPINFFPDWLRETVQWMPFQGIVYTPMMIYLGQVKDIAVLQVVIVQVLWVIGLWFCAVAFFKKAVRVLDIQGG